MYSKIYFLFFGFLLGCGLNVGEVYQNPPLPKTNLECMNSLNDQFFEYINQELPESEVGSFLKCVQSALVAFKHHVRGAKTDEYSPTELRDFIEDNAYLTDHEIPDRLLHQLMTLKVNFVGGEYDKLTDQEIDHINSLLVRLEQFMKSMYPYNQVLFSLKKFEISEINVGLSQLKINLKSLFTSFFKKSYSLEGAYALREDLLNLLDFTEEEGSDQLQGIQLFRPAVNFIFNKNTKTVIQVEEWSDLIDGIVDMYAVFLYTWKASSENVSLEEKVSHYSIAFQQFITALKNTINSQWYGQEISGSRIRSLFHNLYEEGVFPKSIQKDSLGRVVQAFFGKIVAQNTSDDFNFSINMEHVRWMEQEYARWMSLNQLLQKGTQGEVETHQKVHDFYSSQKDLYDRILGDRSLFQFDFGRDYEFIKNAKAIYNESDDKDFNVYIMYDQDLWESGFKNTVFRSFYTSLMRGLFRGYARSFPDKGLMKNELNLFLKDITPLLSNLSMPANVLESIVFPVINLIPYSTEGFYTNSWSERNEEFVSIEEGVGFLSLMNLIPQTMNSLNKELERLCGQDIRSPDCFKTRMFSAVKNSMTHMPQLIEAINNMSLEEQESYAAFLLKLATMTQQDEQESYSVTQVALALIYQELTFTRFDLDKNNILDEPELKDHMNPVYRGLFKYLGYNDQWLVKFFGYDSGKGIFKCIVIDKEAPEHDLYGLSCTLPRGPRPYKGLSRLGMIETIYNIMEKNLASPVS